jgi:predicted dehydrogenase
MDKGNLSRRGFMARSMAGLTLGAGLPVWFARELVAEEEAEKSKANRPVAANERIVMAAIGTGTNFHNRGNGPLRGERGIAIMGDAMNQPGVEIVAVCDVDRHAREFARDQVRNHRNNNNRPAPRMYEDFREVLANRDIQAVLIATPDHWHALIAIAAMRAGKDVYCEKPLTLWVDEGKAIVDVARQTNRKFQTGSQQRSDARFRLACELVRNGRIGRVERVETRIGDNPVGGPFAVAPVPEGLNWDFWQGQTPRVDYIPKRCHYDFRWWYEYSGGKMTDWGAHHNDIAQWGLGMDNSGPVAVEVERADAPSRNPNSFNCHPHFVVRYTYANGPNGANGTVLSCMSDGENGIQFYGEDGKWIFVSRGAIRASDERLLREPLPASAVRLEVSTNHMGNFLQAVRDRSRQPICNANVGHRSVSVCHLGTIALRSGLRLQWNPEQQTFVGENAEAGNRMLRREIREPWGTEWRRLTTA